MRVALVMEGGSPFACGESVLWCDRWPVGATAVRAVDSERGTTTALTDRFSAGPDHLWIRKWTQAPALGHVAVRRANYPTSTLTEQ